MDSGQQMQGAHLSGPQANAPKSGGKNCFCSQKWCQDMFPGGCDKQAKGYPYGGHRLTAIPKDALRKWMTGEQGWFTAEDPYWTKTNIDDMINDTQSDRFKSMRVGRWHFSEDVLKKDGRGRTCLNFADHPQLVPEQSKTDCETAVRRNLGLQRSPPVERRNKRLLEDAAVPGMVSPPVVAQLIGETEKAEQQNERLRAEISNLRAERAAQQSHGNQQAELIAELEGLLHEATVTVEEKEAALEQLRCRSKASLSHQIIMEDPVWRAKVSDVSFFGTPEEHEKFFEMLNDDGMAESLIPYSAELEERDTQRKRKYGPKPGLRRVLAQDQFLLTCVILITGSPYTFVSALFGGVSVSTVSRIFVTWINFLHLFFKEEFPYPTRDQILNCMPDKFISVFGTNKVRQIIDCTEIQMGKPSEPQAARCCWSEYKHRYTIKIFAGISPIGAFIYSSDAYGGRISDPQIVEASSWLELIEALDFILADKGFMINQLMAARFAHCEAPPKKFNLMEFGTLDNLDTAEIAALRMHVERAFGRLKLKCRYFNGILSVDQSDLAGKVFHVCAAFMNYKGPLVGSDFACKHEK